MSTILVEMLTTTIFIQGVLIGLFVSIPMGPIGILCIQRTLQQGRLSGFISGLGAACADTLFASIAGLGLTLVSDFFKEQHTIIMLIGSAVLFVLGLRMFFKNTIKQARAFKYQKSNPLSDFISVFVLTITNPITIIFYGIVFASLGIVQDNIYSLVVLLSGIFCGAISIWFLLSTFVNIFRKYFRLRIIFYINKVAGIILMLFGLFAIYNAFYPVGQDVTGHNVPIIQHK
ncbi:MAG: LysE family translocator [Bacteroidales bacterium]|nr:LysE family translocator [Bacteroidales bacterium]